MSNPSTLWASLSLPNPAAGSVPFVFTDNATIVTDVVNLFYTQLGASLAGTLQNYQLSVAGGVRVNFSDTTSTPGAVTINKPAGRVKIPAGQSYVVITNSYAFSNSIIQVTLEGHDFDATLTKLIVLPASGFFTIIGDAACTAAVTISFNIINVW